MIFQLPLSLGLSLVDLTHYRLTLHSQLWYSTREQLSYGVMSTSYMTRLPVVHNAPCLTYCCLAIAMYENWSNKFGPEWNILYEILESFRFFTSLIRSNEFRFHCGDTCLFGRFPRDSSSTKYEYITTRGFYIIWPGDPICITLSFNHSRIFIIKQSIMLCPF